MRSFATFVALLCLALGVHGKPTLQEFVKQARSEDSGIWALLVAGSNTWYNYRHQADVCHAYQIFHAHGVPDSNIVVMMYDDIANNEQNPDKGKIINKKDGPNVYPGVLKDYTGEDVNPENFMKVLKGVDPGTGSGKVIESGPNDYVFVNFVDHGGVCILAFPDQELSCRQLNETIQALTAGNRYKQLVFYVEACESGSMFENRLPDNTKVYATTASNAHESSYACYYDSKLGTYLGDCYSVNWMENVDADGTETESLEQQFKVVKSETTTSHVMQYGDMSFDGEKLGMFMGSENGQGSKMKKTQTPQASLDAVPSGDVPVGILAHKIFDSPCEWSKREHELALMEELVIREKVRLTIENIVSAVVGSEQKHSLLTSRAEVKHFDCYEPVVRNFSEKCFKLGQVDYALRFTYALANLCEHSGATLDSILQAISKHC